MSHDFVTDLFFSTPPPPRPFPPCRLLFFSTQLHGCRAEESQLLLGPTPTAVATTPILVPIQPNSDRISPKAPSSVAPISPRGEWPYRMLASEISLDPYSITRQKPSPGAVPMVAMPPRLREVARSLPSSTSILTSSARAARGHGRDRRPPRCPVCDFTFV